MIKRQMNLGGGVDFIDDEKKEIYGSIVAGLAWPWVKPGFIVVAAVARVEDVSIEAYPISVLTEAGASDTGSLFREALRLQESFCIETIYADTKNENMVALLDEFNGDRRRRQLDCLAVYEPPFCVNEIAFYLDTIRKHTVANRKRLTFGQESSIPGYLLGMVAEDISGETTLDHPCVAALGYALSELGSWRPRREQRQTRVKLDFNPHDYDRPRAPPAGGSRVTSDFDPRKY